MSHALSFGAQPHLRHSMPVFRIPLVIPWGWDWMATLFFIGIFGFTGQVRRVRCPSTPPS